MAACYLPLPLPIWRVEQLPRRESIAVQPQNKGAIHWLSYLLCTSILCWESFPLSLGTKHHPYKKSNGWAILPQAKEELPNLF